MNKRFRVTNLLRWILNLLLLPAVTASGTARAQDRWQIDPNNSVASLSLGKGSDMLQAGLARISGRVVFEAGDSSDPTVTFNLYSNETRAEYASMSFTSRRCAMTADGKLIVVGDLSVTRVERSVTMEPSEAYAGPQYGAPVPRTDTRQIALRSRQAGLPLFPSGGKRVR